MATGLMLHTGGNFVDEAAFRGVAAPAATRTWNPISNDRFLTVIEQQCDAAGLVIDRSKSRFGLKGDAGEQGFALLSIGNVVSAGNDFGLMIGVMNSVNKTLSARLAFGSRVFVCDNLALAGQVTVIRKHYADIEEVLPALVRQSLTQVGGFKRYQENLFSAFKGVGFDDATELSHFAVELCRNGIVPKSKILDVIDEYNGPRNREQFGDRNVWALYNAVTEVMKPVFGRNLGEATARTIDLTEFCEKRFLYPDQRAALADLITLPETAVTVVGEQPQTEPAEAMIAEGSPILN